jgi:hypothetical protein
VAQEESGGRDILGTYAMAQIYNLGLRINSIDHTLHDPDEGIRVAEIRGKCDNHSEFQASCESTGNGSTGKADLCHWMMRADWERSDR